MWEPCDLYKNLHSSDNKVRAGQVDQWTTLRHRLVFIEPADCYCMQIWLNALNHKHTLSCCLSNEWLYINQHANDRIRVAFGFLIFTVSNLQVKVIWQKLVIYSNGHKIIPRATVAVQPNIHQYLLLKLIYAFMLSKWNMNPKAMTNNVHIYTVPLGQCKSTIQYIVKLYK